jgi:hypothetical protein
MFWRAGVGRGACRSRRGASDAVREAQRSRFGEGRKPPLYTLFGHLDLLVS